MILRVITLQYLHMLVMPLGVFSCKNTSYEIREAILQLKGYGNKMCSKTSSPGVLCHLEIHLRSNLDQQETKR